MKSLAVDLLLVGQGRVRELEVVQMQNLHGLLDFGETKVTLREFRNPCQGCRLRKIKADVFLLACVQLVGAWVRS